MAMDTLMVVSSSTPDTEPKSLENLVHMAEEELLSESLMNRKNLGLNREEEDDEDDFLEMKIHHDRQDSADQYVPMALAGESRDDDQDSSSSPWIPSPPSQLRIRKTSPIGSESQMDDGERFFEMDKT